MKTKKQEKKEKRKHKKQKHKKEKSKKNRKSSTSESESESEAEEWVDLSHQKKRDDWMNDGNLDFDFVPTYGRGEGERKRQRRDQAEAEKLRQQQLLQERELNPNLKVSGMKMLRPSDDDSNTTSSSKSIGDCGYGWLKKAYDRVKEQAEKEGRTLEDVAVERWGSLEKLLSMLNDAKAKMTENQRSRSPSSHMRDRQQRYDREKSHRYQSSGDSHRSDRDSHSSRSEYKKSERESSESHRSRHEDSYRNSSSSHSYKESRRTDYTHEHRGERLRESSHESKKMIRPDDDSTSFSSTESFREPSWKKKRIEKESASSSNNGKHHEEKGHGERTSQSRLSDSSRQPAWKKKDFHKESSYVEKPYSERNVHQTHEESLRDEKTVNRNIKIEAKDDERLSKESVSRVESSDSEGLEEEEEEEENSEKKPRKDIIMNRNELNLLSGRALRAELWGDFKLADEIHRDFEEAKAAREEFESSGSAVHDGYPRDEVIDSAIDCYRLPENLKKLQVRRGIKHSNVVHVGPYKTKYFDDKLSLQQLFEREKMTSVDDQLKMYVDTAAACKDSLVEDYADDASGKVAKKMSEYPKEEKDVKKAIQDYKRMSGALDKCRFCLDKPALLKHTIVGKGDQVFLCVPPYKSLVEGHCYIVPNSHVSSSLLLDENEFSELQAFKRGLGKMFSDKGQAVVFMEKSIYHRYFPHAFIECIPMPKDTADLAPLYFKKAIDEAETEWALNKKLIDLSKKDLRHSVPKGLPYFCVEFSFGGGFAHIIEDEKSFPKHFGKEIVGGMLEIESHDILKAKDEPMKDVFKKVLKLVDDWWKYKEYFKC